MYRFKDVVTKTVFEIHFLMLNFSFYLKMGKILPHAIFKYKRAYLIEKLILWHFLLM